MEFFENESIQKKTDSNKRLKREYGDYIKYNPADAGWTN